MLRHRKLTRSWIAIVEKLDAKFLLLIQPLTRNATLEWYDRRFLTGSLLQMPSLNHHREITRAILPKECAAILQDFFSRAARLAKWKSILRSIQISGAN